MSCYIKSPLNYVGGKYKLLGQILPLFPVDVEVGTFVDLFGGGFNVGCNVSARNYIYNDKCRQVSLLLKYIHDNDTEKLLKEVDFFINTYQLSKTNQDGFLKLREYYNTHFMTSPMLFYVLICHAFNNQIRFNSKGEYNMPFGKDRSEFNPTLRKKFIEFADRLHTMKIDFYSGDFEEIFISSDDFVYVDPPYFNSTASYNEQGGWTVNDEKRLLTFLYELNSRNVKWALSNNLKYENLLLEDFMKNYNVHYLNGSYSNCNYHKIDRSQDCEVLITNY